jgi:polar amino acid transport system substrate-binding protein
VRKDETRIHSFKDVAHLKVGTLKFSVAQDILNKRGDVEVITYETETNIYEDLRNKRLDAVLLDAPIAMYYSNSDPDFKMIKEEIGRLEYGIGLRKSDSALKEALNNALKESISKRELRQIYDRYNLWNPLMAQAFKDSKETETQPTEYEAYLNSQNHSRTLSQRIELYISFLPLLAKGALVTLKISLLSMLVAMMIGLILALMRLYGGFVFSSLALIYIEIIRGTPLLIQLFFIFLCTSTFRNHAQSILGCDYWIRL